MKILVDSNSIVVYISNIANIVSNGIEVDDAVIADKTLQIIDVSSVPNGVKPQAYCYNVTNGFYENKNYVTPLDPIEKLRTDDEKYRQLDLTTASLADVKQAKKAQLNYLCNQTIVNGFDYTVNGVSYHFSCSINAQQNFTGTKLRMDNGKITQKTWTAVDNTTGAISRVTLVATDINAISDIVDNLVDSNVSRFRDTLEPQVDAIVLANYATEADANKAVDAINW